MALVLRGSQDCVWLDCVGLSPRGALTKGTAHRPPGLHASIGTEPSTRPANGYYPPRLAKPPAIDSFAPLGDAVPESLPLADGKVGYGAIVLKKSANEIGRKVSIAHSSRNATFILG
jgi:hypothetical protein